MTNEATPGGLGSNAKLAVCYAELAGLWRTAARHYIERAAKASSIANNTNPDSPWSWDSAAARASRRAARYARMAETLK